MRRAGPLQWGHSHTFFKAYSDYMGNVTVTVMTMVSTKLQGGIGEIKTLCPRHGVFYCQYRVFYVMMRKKGGVSMENRIPVEDLSAPELAVYWKLTENQLRNRLEPEKGIFIAQTGKVISLALENGWEPVSFLMEDGPASGETQQILSQISHTPVYTAPRETLKQLTGYALTRGILCAMRRKPLPSGESLCRSARRLAVLDGVVDASNVGAIIRSAAGLSMDGVLVSSTCCDPLNRRAVRVSMGTVFQIPWTTIESRECISFLHCQGFKVCAMALRKDTVTIDDPNLRREEKLAILLGSEGWGLPEEMLDECDYTVRIPMGHGVDSLNVAAASVVAFWNLKV